jgi:hypothetical protein
MTQPTYQQLILEGIKGLPQEALVEIVDFIYFVRKRTLQPHAFSEEIHQALLNAELRQLSRDEEAHLEDEFADYDRLYPRE